MKQPIKMTPGDDLHLTLLMKPQCLNLIDGQLREQLLGYGRAAFEAGKAGQCLLQIQEPPTKTEALAHYSQQAILAMGEAKPAAVAVLDAEKLLRAEAARLERIYGSHGNKWYGFCTEKALHLEHLRVADALAATPEAVATFELDALPMPQNPHHPATDPAQHVAWACGAGAVLEVVQDAIAATQAAAAPVVLPEPVVIATSKRESPTKGSVDFTWGVDALKEEGEHKLYSEPQVRALLAGVSAPAAQAAEPFGYVNTHTGQFFKDVEPCRKTNEGHWRTVFTEPQAQADARDADDAALVEWLSDQYLAADFHWGNPKTPVLVIEIPPTASVCGDFRTDVRGAIAAQAAQQGGADGAQ